MYEVKLKENSTSKKYRVSRFNNKIGDIKVIQDVVPLRITMPLDFSACKAKATDSKKKKPSKLVSPSKNKPPDPSESEKTIDRDHMDTKRLMLNLMLNL